MRRWRRMEQMCNGEMVVVRAQERKRRDVMRRDGAKGCS